MLLQFRFTQSNFSVLGNHQMSRINVFPFLNIILRFLLYWCHCAESAWECLYDSHNSLLIKMIPKRADAITGIYCTCTCIHFIFRTVTLTVQVTGQLKWKSGNSNHIFLHWKITKLKKKNHLTVSKCLGHCLSHYWSLSQVCQTAHLPNKGQRLVPWLSWSMLM